MYEAPGERWPVRLSAQDKQLREPIRDKDRNARKAAFIEKGCHYIHKLCDVCEYGVVHINGEAFVTAVCDYCGDTLRTSS